MASSLRVRDLMSSDIFTVRPEDPLTKVRDVMDEKHIRHVLVVDDSGALAGLVSDRDLLRQVGEAESELPLSVQADAFTAVHVKDIMTWDVETVEVDESAAVAARAMLDNKYGCLPVVDGGTLVGIVTEADFVRFVAASGEAPEGAPRKGRASVR